MERDVLVPRLSALPRLLNKIVRLKRDWWPIEYTKHTYTCKYVPQYSTSEKPDNKYIHPPSTDLL